MDIRSIMKAKSNLNNEMRHNRRFKATGNSGDKEKVFSTRQKMLNNI
jgi:hypothetical protein